MKKKDINLNFCFSENSQAVFAKAILKDWSEQHEYELGKLTISLLKLVCDVSPSICLPHRCAL